MLIIANTVISEWLARRGRSWETAIREFLAMALVNGGVAVVAWLLLPDGEGELHLGNALFFLLLLTLLVTLYDRYRPLYVTRLETAHDQTAPAPPRLPASAP